MTPATASLVARPIPSPASPYLGSRQRTAVEEYRARHGGASTTTKRDHRLIAAEAARDEADAYARRAATVWADAARFDPTGPKAIEARAVADAAQATLAQAEQAIATVEADIAAEARLMALAAEEAAKVDRAALEEELATLTEQVTPAALEEEIRATGCLPKLVELFDQLAEAVPDLTPILERRKVRVARAQSLAAQLGVRLNSGEGLGRDLQMFSPAWWSLAHVQIALRDHAAVHGLRRDLATWLTPAPDDNPRNVFGPVGPYSVKGQP